MNPSRRTFLLLTGAAAVSRFAPGQYVLPPQPLPSERFPPSPEQLAQIRRKTALLASRLDQLRQRNIADDLLAEVEIFHKASVWIDRFGEYFRPDDAAHSIAVLDIGLARADELDAGTSSWKTATGRVLRAFRSRRRRQCAALCRHCARLLRSQPPRTHGRSSARHQPPPGGGAILGSGANSRQGRGLLGFAALSARDGVKRRAPRSTVLTWSLCNHRACRS